MELEFENLVVNNGGFCRPFSGQMSPKKKPSSLLHFFISSLKTYLSCSTPTRRTRVEVSVIVEDGYLATYLRYTARLEFF